MTSMHNLRNNMTGKLLLFIFEMVLFYVSNTTCFCPSGCVLFGSSVFPKPICTFFHSSPLVPGVGAFAHARTPHRKLDRPLRIALSAREQDEDEDDEVEITTYLSCPKCMSDHFILREVLGEGRHVLYFVGCLARHVSHPDGTLDPFWTPYSDFSSLAHKAIALKTATSRAVTEFL